MKPRNREINVFNLSMLDVISGALGAVLIVMVVIFPFYGMERTEDEYRRLQERVKELEKDAKIGRIRNPFTLLVSWRTEKHDVDVFIHDGSSRAPNYDPTKKFAPYWPGDTGTESKNGPAQEVRVVRDVPPGEYKIYLNLYDKAGNPEPAIVHTILLHNKFIRLPSVRLPTEKKAFYLGSLIMDDNRNLTYRGATPGLQQEYENLNKKDN